MMKVPPVRTVFYPRSPSLLCRKLYSASSFLQTHITTHFMCRILTQLSMGLPRQTLQQPRNEVCIWTVIHSAAVAHGTLQQTARTINISYSTLV
jgi:hypothetical protein